MRDAYWISRNYQNSFHIHSFQISYDSKDLKLQIDIKLWRILFWPNSLIYILQLCLHYCHLKKMSIETWPVDSEWIFLTQFFCFHKIISLNIWVTENNNATNYFDILVWYMKKYHLLHFNLIYFPQKKNFHLGKRYFLYNVWRTTRLNISRSYAGWEK